jgi:hypothetical protein
MLNATRTRSSAKSVSKFGRLNALDATIHCDHSYSDLATDPRAGWRVEAAGVAATRGLIGALLARPSLLMVGGGSSATPPIDATGHRSRLMAVLGRGPYRPINVAALALAIKDCADRLGRDGQGRAPSRAR